VKPQQPPKHLQSAGRRLFTDIATAYAIDDQAGIALLTEAAECPDRQTPLLERKTLLEHVLGKSGQKRIFPTTYVGLNAVALFDAADQAELEGIVAKRVDSPYRRGRSRDWLKIKTKHG